MNDVTSMQSVEAVSRFIISGLGSLAGRQLISIPCQMTGKHRRKTVISRSTFSLACVVEKICMVNVIDMLIC